MVDVRLWGKEEGLARPYPLIGHLLDTGVVAGVLWDEFLPEAQQAAIAGELGVAPGEARLLVRFWAALHDVGKIQRVFQFQSSALKHVSCAELLADGAFADRDAGDSGFTVLPHQFASARVVPALLAELGYPMAGRGSARWLTVQVGQMLGGHHGRYQPLPGSQREVLDPLRAVPELGAGGWEVQRREHVAALVEVLGHPEVPASAQLPASVAVVVTGLVVTADWIASQEDFVRRQQAAAVAGEGLATAEGRAEHAVRAAREAPDLLRGAGLGRAVFAVRGFADRFPEIGQPHPLQVSVDSELRARGPSTVGRASCW